jgi:FAD/FMN-containing dehydrogenase
MPVPLGALPGNFSLLGLAVLADPTAASAIEEALHALRSAMAGYDTSRAFSSFTERPVDPATLLAREDYERLQAVRADVDPDGLMAACHPIPRSQDQ